jgi:uncharacterized protein YfcZ (UPF0381/DUF406 family)
MVSLVILISIAGGFLLGLLIGLYLGFIMDKNDKGKIRRFYNEREDGEGEIRRLKEKLKEMENKK